MGGVRRGRKFKTAGVNVSPVVERFDDNRVTNLGLLCGNHSGGLRVVRTGDVQVAADCAYANKGKCDDDQAGH